MQDEISQQPNTSKIRTHLSGRKENVMKKTVIALAAIVGAMAAATTVSAATISQESAKRTALEAAGVQEERVIFKAVETDYDDGREIYEVDFFIPGEIKYEYDIDANTGEIVEQDTDLWEADDYVEYAYLIEAAGIR